MDPPAAVGKLFDVPQRPLSCHLHLALHRVERTAIPLHVVEGGRGGACELGVRVGDPSSPEADPRKVSLPVKRGTIGRVSVGAHRWRATCSMRTLMAPPELLADGTLDESAAFPLVK